MAGRGRRARQRVRRLLRRGRVRGAQAVALLALAAPAPAGAVELGAAINDAGFAFGGAAYRDTFTANYDAATAESAMKMTALQPERGRFEFAHADAIVDWARGAGKQVHGHVLVWCADEWNPAWVTGRSWTREELLAVMEDHIRTVMDHFEGRVETWDVVNEALLDDGSRRDCVWQRHIGDDWVAQAFRIARESDPAARLFYNEWRAEVPNPKFEALVALVRDLPLDGVGLQHHTYGFAPLQYQVEDAIAQLGELGLQVHVSELNVTTSQIGGDLALQAQGYWTIAAACAAQPACFRVTTWGFTDRYGWRPPSEKAMPFDVDYAPKPAWHALRRGVGRDSGPALPPPGPPGPAGGDTIAWPAVDGARYALQHRDARGTWRTLASGIPVPTFAIAEPEGTWEYRVRAEDGPWSEPSAPLKVDRTPPGAPTVPPEWLRAPATVQLLAVDPPLPDGSPGSGVEPPPVHTLVATGELRGTVRDRAGNVSPEGGGLVRVDAAPPAVALSCPPRVVRGSGSVGRWTAVDAESGVAGPPAGTVPLDGRASVTVRDVAGNAATATCDAAVVPPLRLYTRRATVRDGILRLRIGCRLPLCRSTLTLRRAGRVVGARRVSLAGTRSVSLPTRRAGRLVVLAGRDRLGAVQTRRR